MDTIRGAASIRINTVFQLRRVFQTQVPISLVILVIGIQDLYTSKYKYTIRIEIIVDF